jgi:hypothetical protein
MLIYDFKNKIIERFEPFGILSIQDYIDDILEEELTWNTGFKYLRSRDYIDKTGFQYISDEINEKNRKHGDPGGFCLAWCYWYLETKLKNPDIDSKTLVSKLIKKLNNQDIKVSEYIRNYANKLNNERNKYLEIIGIDKKKFYDLTMTYNDENKIMNYVNERSIKNLN